MQVFNQESTTCMDHVYDEFFICFDDPEEADKLS
jgi:hypothetical protein